MPDPNIYGQQAEPQNKQRQRKFDDNEAGARNLAQPGLSLFVHLFLTFGEYSHERVREASGGGARPRAM